MPLPALLLPIISSVAPTLIRMATGSNRAEEVTRSVSNAVNEVVGIKPDTPDKAEQALQAIQADPTAYAKLQQRLAAIEQAELEVLLADRADARARDIEVRKISGGLNTRANVMLAMAFIAIITITLGLVWLNFGTREQSGDALQFTGAIIGFLTGIGGMFARNIGSAFDFEFGSSRGSKNKDGQIEDLTRQLQNASEHVGSVDSVARTAKDAVTEAAVGVAANAALDAFRRRMAG